MHLCKLATVVCVFSCGLLGSAAQAVDIDLVTVGNPGNAPDMRYWTPGHGAVDYTFQMGRFEITAGQYCAFLNAVAADDIYCLYRAGMAFDGTDRAGCNIQRVGTPGSYTYTVAADWANRPVNWVSWAGAARFCNWLTNGQPTGAQDSTTTEAGSYVLNGLTNEPELDQVVRTTNARYVIPSEDEWYKAAYYDPNKPGGPGYWDYPTCSNAPPSNTLDPGGTNNANYSDTHYTIGPPYYTSEVGAFANSPGPYGAFDQGGNVVEWTETVVGGPGRQTRGGSFGGGALHASYSGSWPYGLGGWEHNGLRVAYVPEPTCLLFLATAVLLAMRRRSC